MQSFLPATETATATATRTLQPSVRCTLNTIWTRQPRRIVFTSTAGSEATASFGRIRTIRKQQFHHRPSFFRTTPNTRASIWQTLCASEDIRVTQVQRQIISHLASPAAVIKIIHIIHIICRKPTFMQ